MSDSSPASRYVGEPGRAYHEGKRALPPPAIPWVVRARAELFQPFVAATASVLEWGCGYGWNLAGLRCARRVGYDVAVDLEPAIAGAGIEFARDPSVLPPASFEVIICHHALEHLPDPWRTLQEFARLLRPEGALLLAVPFERERRYRRFDATEPNHHLFSWNVQTLGNLLTAAGWKCESLGLRRYGYDRRAAQLATRLGWGESGFRVVRSTLQGLRPLFEIVAVARIEFRSADGPVRPRQDRKVGK